MDNRKVITEMRWIMAITIAIMIFIALGLGWKVSTLPTTSSMSNDSTVADVARTEALAIGIVREYLAGRPWGNKDCLRRQEQYSDGPFTAKTVGDGAVEVRHLATFGLTIWRVFVDEKVIEPVKRPDDSSC